MIARTNLVRLICPDRGIELLCTTGAADLPARSHGSAALAPDDGPGGEHQGVASEHGRRELDQVLKDQDYRIQELIVPDVHYQYYRELGLAVRLRQGVVEELVIVQLPH